MRKWPPEEQPISKTLVDYQFLFGDFENGSLQAFQKWFGGGSGTPEDALAAPADAATPDNGQNGAVALAVARHGSERQRC